MIVNLHGPHSVRINGKSTIDSVKDIFVGHILYLFHLFTESRLYLGHFCESLISYLFSFELISDCE